MSEGGQLFEQGRAAIQAREGSYLNEGGLLFEEQGKEVMRARERIYFKRGRQIFGRESVFIRAREADIRAREESYSSEGGQLFERGRTFIRARKDRYSFNNSQLATPHHNKPLICLNTKFCVM